MAHPGTLHIYTKSLVAFEHNPPSTSTTTPSQSLNTLLWIGGLSDGLLTVQYPTAIAASLPPSWRLAEVLLTSSYSGWATGTLKRDASELGECVAYFKKLRKGGKMVIMGHSTGCQDCMEYLTGEGSEEREGVDGVVLQAGVSDREAWDDMAASDSTGETARMLGEIRGTAEKLVKEDKGDDILSDEDVQELFETPVSAYRAWSLLVKGGDDDFFSADLSDETLKRSFGKIPKGTRAMWLWGGADKYVPKGVDGRVLLGRWTRVLRDAGGRVDETHGGIVKGASHNLNGDAEEVVKDLVGRVVGFVEGLEG